MKPRAVDPVELAIFQSAVHSIAEEWARRCGGRRFLPTSRTTRLFLRHIRRSARVIAMGDHMPVHLGSMPMSVQAAVAAIEFAPGILPFSTTRMQAEHIFRTSPWFFLSFCLAA